MDPARRSAEVVGELLRKMAETVVSYHPVVRPTSSTIEGLIQGTACFPGGAGLWRGKRNGGPLPVYFPESPLMFVGHNFDSERGYAISLARGGEAEGDFWTRLLRMLESAGLRPAECFFSNALIGLKPGKAEGEMPSVRGYKEQCQSFLQRQVEIVRPRAVVALGVQAIRYVSKLTGRHVALRHPGDWCFRSLATRDALLVAEGRKLREFLDLLEGGLNAVAAPKACLDGAHQELYCTTAVPAKEQTTRKTITYMTGTDAWGFRIGTRNSFLMQKLEQGGKSKEEIRLEFLHSFPDSVGKSTFNVFFTDVVRPFGSASVSRCIRIESDERGRLHLDIERARRVKVAVAAGILTEINSLEGTFPKKNQQAIDAIIEKYNTPRK
jgi:hypothetical protein